MLELVLKTINYKFIVDEDGTDHLEGNQYIVDELLGKGVIHFSNKRGGIMFVIFIGDLSTTKKADVISKIEESCGLKYIGQEDAFFWPEYERNLRSIYGDKLVVKKQ